MHIAFSGQANSWLVQAPLDIQQFKLSVYHRPRKEIIAADAVDDGFILDLDTIYPGVVGVSTLEGWSKIHWDGFYSSSPSTWTGA